MRRTIAIFVTIRVNEVIGGYVMRVLLLLALAVPCSADVYLAVFAHPDDESTVGNALAKFAAEGHDVYLVTLTSGQAGNANTDIPKGPKLGAAREAEARCAAKALGIHEPFLPGFQDGDISSHGTLNRIAETLREIFEEVRPDVVITWGPDGLTGHPDHRVASNVTTEIFQQASSLEAAPKKLYYVAWPAKLMQERAPETFARMLTVDERHITDRIDAADYIDPLAASIRCHETQWDQAMMEQNIALARDAFEGRVFLRLALEN